MLRLLLPALLVSACSLLFSTNDAVTDAGVPVDASVRCACTINNDIGTCILRQSGDPGCIALCDSIGQSCARIYSADICVVDPGGIMNASCSSTALVGSCFCVSAGD